MENIKQAYYYAPFIPAYGEVVIIRKAWKEDTAFFDSFYWMQLNADLKLETKITIQADSAEMTEDDFYRMSFDTGMRRGKTHLLRKLNLLDPSVLKLESAPLTSIAAKLLIDGYRGSDIGANVSSELEKAMDNSLFHKLNVVQDIS